MPEQVSVFKVFRPAEWSAFERAGTFEGSADDLRDGFIHLSTAAQLEATISKHFVGERPLVIAEFSTPVLGHHLRWEAASSGSVYPHLFVPLHRAQVTHHYRVEHER